MRTILSLCLCLLLLTPIAALAHYTHGVGDAFVLIQATSEDGPALQDGGLYLVAELQDGYLAFVDQHELAHLRNSGMLFEVLVERDDKSLEYLIVHKHESIKGHAHAQPHPAARLLFAGEHYDIMSVPATLLEAQPNCIPELQRVYRRPLSFVRTPWTEPEFGARDVVLDQALVDALAAITQSPLEEQVQALQDFGTRHSEYNGGYLASLWIQDQFLSFGYTDVTLHDYNSWNDNVVCVKPGAVFPDEVVVIGGHYDTISYDGNANAPGADDNASGSVAVLEAARVFKDIEFERTLVFICFSGEEEGLVGSDAWAEDAANDNMNIIGMVNIDMICYQAAGDAEDLDIISNSASEPMAQMAFDVIDAYVPDLVAVDGFLTSGSSDHAAFWSHGFRALFFFEDSGDYSPYLHTANDVIGPSANNFPFMLKNVRAVTAVTGTLARPFHVSIDHDPLGNSVASGPFPLTATLVAADPLAAETLKLNYRANGGDFIALPLVATGPPNEYGATIPVQAPGTHIEYYLAAGDVSGNMATSPDNAPEALHGFRTGIDFVFIEDCETDQGWQLGAAGDDATTGIWIRANPVGTSYQAEDDHSADPGTLCFVTGNADPGDTAGTNDVDGGRTTLLSPIFDLSDATWAGLSYWRWYADATTLDDDFFVDISNDGGDNWQNLETVLESAYPWVKAEFNDLAGIIDLTAQMRLRFVAVDEGGGSLVEALIDDLEVVAITGDLTSVEEPPAFVASLTAHPNPFNPKTVFDFTLPRSGRADLRIFDMKGAVRARPVSGNLNSGIHSVTFDGSGLPSGIYLVRLTLDGEEMATSKITMVK
ncbi:MAG: M20/M25/M40 family metallo-hydrolase [bacterium]|nr:M20/M25/M40 family metallo-hydrolase [bacterium]